MLGKIERPKDDVASSVRTRLESRLRRWVDVGGGVEIGDECGQRQERATKDSVQTFVHACTHLQAHALVHSARAARDLHYLRVSRYFPFHANPSSFAIINSRPVKRVPAIMVRHNRERNKDSS